MDRKLQQGKHLDNKTPVTEQPTQKKRFTCFKAKGVNVPSAFGLYEKMPNGF